MRTFEITKEVNEHAMREYQESLTSLYRSADILSQQLNIATVQGNQRAIGELALGLLQCTLASTALAWRAAGYYRCTESSKFSKEFWQNLTQN